MAPGADKKRITLMRRTATGSFTTTTLKIDEMVAGKIPMEYLSPGDQIVVPEKKWSLTKILDVVNSGQRVSYSFWKPYLIEFVSLYLRSVKTRGSQFFYSNDPLQIHNCRFPDPLRCS